MRETLNLVHDLTQRGIFLRIAGGRVLARPDSAAPCELILQRARAFILGLVAGLPRKNCWTIAEHAGDDNPGGMQHLLSQALG
jgi:hypothetical protein